jgi:heme exporter protein CcmD
MFEIFDMGPYNFYVWGSVASALLLMGVFAWRSYAQFQKIRQQIKWSVDVQS